MNQPLQEIIWYEGVKRVEEERAAAAVAAAEARKRAQGPQQRVQVAQRVSGCQYEQMIRDRFGEAGDWAMRIAWRESNCQPGVTSRDGAVGLFQLLGHGDLANGCSLYDPQCNVDAAYRLWNNGSGACHWSAPNYCSG